MTVSLHEGDYRHAKDIRVVHTEERPSEDTEGGWPPASPGKKPVKESTLLTA